MQSPKQLCSWENPPLRTFELSAASSICFALSFSVFFKIQNYRTTASSFHDPRNGRWCITGGSRENESDREIEEEKLGLLFWSGEERQSVWVRERGKSRVRERERIGKREGTIATAFLSRLPMILRHVDFVLLPFALCKLSGFFLFLFYYKNENGYQKAFFIYLFLLLGGFNNLIFQISDTLTLKHDF